MMNDSGIHALRKAIAAGEFSRAARLWDEFASRLQESIQQGECDPARMRELRELVSWSASVLQCARAHMQSEISSMWVAVRYSQESGNGPAGSAGL